MAFSLQSSTISLVLDPLRHAHPHLTFSFSFQVPGFPSVCGVLKKKNLFQLCFPAFCIYCLQNPCSFLWVLSKNRHQHGQLSSYYECRIQTPFQPRESTLNKTLTRSRSLHIQIWEALSSKMVTKGFSFVLSLRGVHQYQISSFVLFFLSQ